MTTAPGPFGPFEPPTVTPPDVAPPAPPETWPPMPSAADPVPPVASVAAVGSVVANSYFDPYSDAGPGGAQITVYGIVVGHSDVDDGTGTIRRTVRVAWLSDVSDAMPPEELTTVI